MSDIDFTTLTDAELLAFALQNKPSPLFDAIFIGFLVGILLFAAMVNGWGLVMMIPIFHIRQFLKKPKRHEALMAEMRKRGM